MEWLTMDQWSPYGVGIGIGVLNCIAFVVSDKFIGCSGAFVRTSGMFERVVRGEKVCDKPYYQKFPITIDWEWMLVIGVAVGAYVSAKLSGQLELNWLPSVWSTKFGFSTILRCAVALIGGFLIGVGARWAGGCTSGHGISGTMQLALSSWLAALCFFIGGIATAKVLY